MATTTFKLVSPADLAPNSLKAVTIDGKPVLLANVNGTYFAIGNKCTHRGCLLSNGKLNGDTVKCPCHGSIFDLKTGAVVHGPAKTPEPNYEAKIENQQVYINV
jgi:3-phenylpropionate/trans-cinnamate dioxygenase ferredoxin subunit/naphthalene 1,2-dioxygenase system ferredoxin subunit